MDKGKLYLTSGGFLDGQRGEELDKTFEKICKGKKVLFINNATVTGSNSKAKAIVMNNFKMIGAEIDCITLDNSNVDVIHEYDCLYITGGDCAPLIHLANNSDFKDQLLNFLRNDGVVFGESAGSIIFGNDIKWYYDVKKGTKPKYDVILPVYSGLGLVDINFHPHYNKTNDEYREKIENYEEENDVIITKVNDGEWLEYNYLDLAKKNIRK